jgi:hypothetical protein
MKSTLASAPNASAKITSRSISEVADAPYEIGFLNKTDKSKGYHFLTKDVEDVLPPPDDETLVIEDGNAAFYYLKDLPPNFRDISAKLFAMVVRKSDIIFSNGYYVLAQQLKGEINIIRAPNTTKKFNELLFVFFIGKEGLPVWLLFRIFTSNNQFFTATSGQTVCYGSQKVGYYL